MSNKSILIVGGTGVISFAVVNEALKQGYSVTCINRGRSRTQILDESVEVIISDYKDEERIKQALEGRFFDAVVDVLCYTIEDIWYSTKLFGYYCKQYIFFSSAEAYNKPKYEDQVYNEDVEMVNPLWDYSINKAQCEEELKRVAKNYNFKYTIIRPAITYGNTRIPYGFMPPYGYHGTIIQRILNHKPLILFNGGNNIATVLHVEDFAIGLVGLIGNEKAYNQDYHISGDEYVSWKMVLDVLGRVLGVEPLYIDIDSKFIGSEMPSLSQQIVGGRSYSQRLDNSKLKEAVPFFRTNISLYEGVKRTVDYYSNHQYLNGIDYSFDADMDRIISKWCGQKGISTGEMNLGFIDYLGNATANDKRKYRFEFYKDSILIKYAFKGVNFARRVLSRIKKSF